MGGETNCSVVLAQVVLGMVGLAMILRRYPIRRRLYRKGGSGGIG
jgi:hypothetical protein